MTDTPPTSRWRANPESVGSPADPRFSLANERTFLAWNRTALALIGGGLAAAQLLHFGIGGGSLIVGLPLIVLGAVAALAGVRRWRSREFAMRLETPLPRSRLAPAFLGAGAGVIAVLSLVLLTIDQL